MNIENQWNREPSPCTVMKEPIIQMLMTRDHVDIATVRRFWTEQPRSTQSPAMRPSRTSAQGDSDAN